MRPRYQGETELPWAAGSYRGPDADAAARLASGRARWTLSGMAGEYRFFSPGLLPTLGAPVDFVALHWREENLPAAEAPLWLDLGRVVFRGLPPPLDAVLFACPRPYAAKLFADLDRVAVRTRTLGVLNSVRQELRLVDWPLVDRTAVAPAAPPVVPVTLYGAAAAGGSYLFKPPARPLDPFTVVWRPAATPRTPP